MTIRPLLAATLAEGQTFRYPLWVSPKIDGIRALAKDGQLFSRNGILIPNHFIQGIARRSGWHNLDGELIVGAPYALDLLQRTQSAVRSAFGTPLFAYMIFDHWDRKTAWLPPTSITDPYMDTVPQNLIYNQEELLFWENFYLSLGYEGLMGRSTSAPSCYKHGRSTMKEQHLVKIKRFSEDEAIVLSVIELQRNTNPSALNELGYIKRSTRAYGMAPTGDLGALHVRSLAGPFKGKEFDVGSGFSADQRSAFWAIRATLPGSIITVKYFPYGAKDLPRFPIFKTFRPGPGKDI